MAPTWARPGPACLLIEKRLSILTVTQLKDSRANYEAFYWTL